MLSDLASDTLSDSVNSWVDPFPESRLRALRASARFLHTFSLASIHRIYTLLPGHLLRKQRAARRAG